MGGTSSPALRRSEIPLQVCWRCGVLTTQGGITKIGFGHLLGREHDSTHQSGAEAPRLLSPTDCIFVVLVVVVVVELFIILKEHFSKEVDLNEK